MRRATSASRIRSQGPRKVPSNHKCQLCSVTRLFGLDVPAFASSESLSTTTKRHGTARNTAVRDSAQEQAPGTAYYVGIDFGTSGGRMSILNDASEEVATGRVSYDRDDGGPEPLPWTEAWETAFDRIFDQIPQHMRPHVKRVAVDATSPTVVLIDRGSGVVLEPAKLYHEAQPPATVEAAADLVPEGHASLAATSSLSKLLSWHQEGALARHTAEGAVPQALHQADWLSSLLTGERSASDWNNALKIGLDVNTLRYGAALENAPISDQLPQKIVQPGATIAGICPRAAERFQLPVDCEVAAGTTDAMAAFLASGVAEVGEAVSSLGSTLAIKLLSDTPVDDSRYGVYSHRLGMGWLVGGGSNTGGAALKKYFSGDELAALSQKIDPETDSGLQYYPLPRTGERFPVCDPEKVPVLEPRPSDDSQFLHGMLEGIARIEGEAYTLLRDLGASEVTSVLTAGGGASNDTWTRIRSRKLGVNVAPSPHGEASYGSALLAQRGPT